MNSIFTCCCRLNRLERNQPSYTNSIEKKREINLRKCLKFFFNRYDYRLKQLHVHEEQISLGWMRNFDESSPALASCMLPSRLKTPQGQFKQEIVFQNNISASTSFLHQASAELPRL